MLEPRGECHYVTRMSQGQMSAHMEVQGACASGLPGASARRALCTPHRWYPLPLGASPGGAVEAPMGLGAQSTPCILAQGRKAYSSQPGTVAQTHWGPAHCRALPRSAAPPATATRDLGPAPWRRCPTQPAPPAGQGGAQTGLPLLQIIVHWTARGAGKEAAWAAPGLALSFVSSSPRGGHRPSRPGSVSAAPNQPGG